MSHQEDFFKALMDGRVNLIEHEGGRTQIEVVADNDTSTLYFYDNLRRAEKKYLHMKQLSDIDTWLRLERPQDGVWRSDLRLSNLIDEFSEAEADYDRLLEFGSD